MTMRSAPPWERLSNLSSHWHKLQQQKERAAACRLLSIRSHDECSEWIAADALCSGRTGSAVADITCSIHHSEGGGGGGRGFGSRETITPTSSFGFLHMSELKKVTRLKYQHNPPPLSPAPAKYSGGIRISAEGSTDTSQPERIMGMMRWADATGANDLNFYRTFNTISLRVFGFFFLEGGGVWKKNNDLVHVMRNSPVCCNCSWNLQAHKPDWM